MRKSELLKDVPAWDADWVFDPKGQGTPEYLKAMENMALLWMEELEMLFRKEQKITACLITLAGRLAFFRMLRIESYEISDQQTGIAMNAVCKHWIRGDVVKKMWKDAGHAPIDRDLYPPMEIPS